MAKQAARKARTSAPAFVEAQPVDEATLEVIRNKVREARSLEVEIETLNERTSEKNKELSTIRHETLPEMFAAVGIDTLGVPAEGNYPAYDCKLANFYRANIPTSWSPEKRKEAFDYIEKSGDGDLIKTEYVVLLPRGERKNAKALEAFLKKSKLEYTVDMSIPWATLTAYVKERIEKHGDVLPLDKLGAQVGMVVKVTKRRDTTTAKKRT
jgi:hypothetical protein